MDAMSYCGGNGSLLKRVFWGGRLAALGGKPQTLLEIASSTMKQFDTPIRTKELLKLVYVIGKTFSFDIIGSTWFNGLTLEEKRPMTLALLVYRRMLLTTQQATMTWLCIARFRLQFHRDLTHLIAVQIWEGRFEVMRDWKGN